MEKKEMPKVKFRDGFIPYIPGKIDTDSQENEKLNKLEELIFKPIEVGIEHLTDKEIEAYLSINIEKLKGTEIGIKTILLCEATQQALRKMKENDSKKAKSKEEKEGEAR